MKWSDIPRNPSTRMLRQFTGLGFVVFGGLALKSWIAGGDTLFAAGLGGLAAALGLLGLIRPGALRPIFVGWLIAVFPIGWLVSRAIVVMLFFGVLTPFALCFRLFGRDLLQRHRRARRESYWTRKTTGTTATSYLRQY